MNELSLSKIEDLAITIANSALGDIETKYEIKNVIMDVVAWACVAYVKDENFKIEIDNYNANNIITGNS